VAVRVTLQAKASQGSLVGQASDGICTLFFSACSWLLSTAPLQTVSGENKTGAEHFELMQTMPAGKAEAQAPLRTLSGGKNSGGINGMLRGGGPKSGKLLTALTALLEKFGEDDQEQEQEDEKDDDSTILE